MAAASLSTHATQQSLQIELETYNAKLPELISNVGKFVLIKGAEIAGIYDTYADALRVGYERFQLASFMVKEIAPTDQIQFFTRDIAFECQA